MIRFAGPPPHGNNRHFFWLLLVAPRRNRLSFFTQDPSLFCANNSLAADCEILYCMVVARALSQPDRLRRWLKTKLSGVRNGN